MNELLGTAEKLARKAGAHALAGRAQGDFAVATKSTSTDIVTRYDRECETMIVGGLRELRPDDAIVGEEGASSPGTTGIEWHVDPIDGTVNYLYGLPGWAVSVGARDADGPIVGAVYVPALDEMFCAARGGGATLNGRPVSVNDATSLPMALVATGFAYDASVRARQGAVVSAMIGGVRDIRRLGAASVDLCFVACGRLDAYFEAGLHSWDTMAARLVVTEAGGTVSSLDGGPVRDDEIMAAAPGVHAALVDLRRRAAREVDNGRTRQGT
ncbi:MAG: hypothetical protein RLZZ305_1423 [Actinomycetota bacterium]